MAALTDEVKMFIVQSLARYDTPSKVAEAVNQEFGLVIERQQVARYDPTKKSGEQLSKKFRDVFEATRETFLKDVSKIPAANQAYRLHKLQQVIERAERRNNDVMLLDALERAAKEAGGFYTNKVKVGGDESNPLVMWLQQVGGGSIPVVHDVEEGELIEHEPRQVLVPSGKIRPRPKRRFIYGRD